jgi:hypothetical protein
MVRDQIFSRLGIMKTERQFVALPPAFGEAAMAHYRLYFMNSGSGHIDSAEDLEAGDDRAAIAAARGLVKEKPIELWCGTRKVDRFEARPRLFTVQSPVSS